MSPATAVAAVGSPFGHILFAVKMRSARTPLAAFAINFYVINEIFHEGKNSREYRINRKVLTSAPLHPLNFLAQQLKNFFNRSFAYNLSQFALGFVVFCQRFGFSAVFRHAVFNYTFVLVVASARGFAPVQ